MSKDSKDKDPFLIRNLVYGIEDSLISTTGVIVGVSLSGLTRRDILVTGIILVLVEALSMSFGAFLSEDSFMTTANIEHTPRTVATYAGIMFISYFLAGLIPLLPFVISKSPSTAWPLSIVLAMVSLFVLVAKVQGNPKKALAYTTVGTIIMCISIGAGRSLKT